VNTELTFKPIKKYKRELPNGGFYHFEVLSYEKELNEFNEMMDKLNKEVKI
jgi:hypothetical protein